MLSQLDAIFLGAIIAIYYKQTGRGVAIFGHAKIVKQLSLAVSRLFADAISAAANRPLWQATKAGFALYADCQMDAHLATRLMLNHAGAIHRKVRAGVNRAVLGHRCSCRNVQVGMRGYVGPRLNRLPSRVLLRELLLCGFH